MSGHPDANDRLSVNARKRLLDKMLRRQLLIALCLLPQTLLKKWGGAWKGALKR